MNLVFRKLTSIGNRYFVRGHLKSFLGESQETPIEWGEKTVDTPSFTVTW